nr:hypothetical protein [Tanacetum cinerariifolium]
MTGNISYLSYFEPFDEGYVSFGQGRCKITGKGTIKTGKLEFKNVYFVKDLKYNLFSVSQICDNKNNVLFTDSECIMLGRDFKLLDDANIMLWTPRQHNMYSIDLNNIVPHRDLTCLVAKASANECTLWHRRLGHLNVKTMNKLVRHNLVRGLPTKNFDNDHTCTACLKGKQHKASWIKREFSNATTPQQNGVAKRRNRTLIEVARTMLADAKLPVTFWAEAVNTACYVQNRVLVNKSQNKTPYKLFNGRTHVIAFFKPSGCHVMILNTLDHLGKFEAKGDEGYFIGYSMSSKAFRVFNKRNRRVEENLHVEFLENKAIEKGAGLNWLFDIDFLTKSMNYVPVDAGTNSTNLSVTKDATNQEVKKEVSSLRYIALPNWVHDALLESSSSKPQDGCSPEVPKGSGNINPTASTTNPPADQMETLTVETSIPTVSLPILTACLNDSLEPSSDARLISKRVANQEETPSLDNILSLTNQFEDILGVKSSPDEAIRVEADVNNMETTITASPTPTLKIHKDHPKIRPIGTKWVLKNKKDEIGIVVRNKARLVAQGHTQEEGIDYDEVFAPVARIEAIRLFLAYASFMGFTVYQMDVKSAFLYDTIDEEVYVMQPPGFQDSEFPTKVYKVEKALPDIMFVVCACARHQVTPKECHLHEVKRIFRYLKGHLKLGLWYPKESPFDLVAYSDSDYGGATQDRKFTTGRSQFLGRRLISWQCKKQTIVATSKTEAEYVTAASCCGQVEHVMRGFVKGNINIYTLFVSHIVLGWVIGTSNYWGVLRMLMIGLRLILLGEGSGTPTESHHTPSLEADPSYHTTSSMPPPSIPTTHIPPVTQPVTTPIRQYTRRVRNAQSYALPTVADEPAFLMRDVSKREACPTESGFIADQDRATIAKSSTLPHDLAPRVTSPAADEGSMQQTIFELTNLYTSLQRQHSELLAKFQAQEVEILKLKDMVKVLEDREGIAATRSGDDAPIKGRSIDEGEAATERISDDSKELPRVLTSIDAATVLVGGINVPTGSGSIPTAGPPVVDIHTGSDAVPIASPIVATSTVVTPYSRRKGKEVMVENNLGWKVKDFKGMTFKEIEAKFATVWKLVEDFIPMGSKEEAERLKRKGFNLEQEKAKKQKTSKEVPDKEKSPKEIPKKKVKEMMQLVPIEEVQYTRRARIAQSSVLPIVADEPASPLHDEVEINRLKERVKLLEDREGVAATKFRDDAPIKGRSIDEGEAATERISDDSEEMVTILTSMDAATILASGVVDVPTGSGSIPTASTLTEEQVPTGNDVVPTASPVFAIATVIDAQVARELEEQLEREDQRRSTQIARDAEIARIYAEEELQIMIDGLDINNEIIAKYLQEYHQFALELSMERRIELITDLVKYQDNYAKIYKYQSQQRKSMSKKQKRDYYMAVIRNNLGWKVKDFRGMTFKEVEAKFNSVWKQMEDFIPMGSKEEAEKIKRKGLNLEQESAKKQKTSKEVPKEAISPEEVPEEKVKEMMHLVPIEEVYVEPFKLNILSLTGRLTLRDRGATRRLLVEWKLYDICGVHHVTSKDKEICMLVEKDYPLRKGLALVMISYKIQVENYSQMTNDLILKIYKIANSPRQQCEARIWLDKEPLRSILTWEDLVSKFINQFFPPSKTTYLRNEITNFCRNPTKRLMKRGNDLTGGNFLDKIPRECLSIIESKSKVRYSRSRVTDVRANMNAPLSSSSPSNSFDLQEIPASLEDKLDIRINRFEKSLNDMKNYFVTPTAPLKAVKEVCVTCGANHSYNNCPLTRGNDFLVFKDKIQ